MSGAIAVKMDQLIYGPNGAALCLDSPYGLHGMTVNTIVDGLNSLKLGSEVNTQITGMLNTLKAAPLTLSMVCCAVLWEKFADERQMPNAEVEMSRFKLALRIHGSHEVEITDDDRATILPRVARQYDPIVYGQVDALLRGEKIDMTPAA